jgi:hypothetical protein
VSHDEDVQKEAKGFGVEGTSLATANPEEKNGKTYLTGRSLSGTQHRGDIAHLACLSGDRYGLAFVEDRIVVVDHDNAGEVRAIDTFSGGETFPA